MQAALYNSFRTQSFGTQAFSTTKRNIIVFSMER